MPIGTVWAAGSWVDDAWAEGSWADAEETPDVEPARRYTVRGQYTAARTIPGTYTAARTLPAADLGGS